MNNLNKNTIYEDSLEEFLPKQSNKSIIKCTLLTICIFFLGLLSLSFFLPWSTTLKGHFNIIRDNDIYYAFISLPAVGTGEIEKDMLTNLYTYNYPDFKYGHLQGKVVSFIDNNELEKSNLYIVKIRIGKELKTNYGYNLSEQIQLRGEGEIIIKEQRLIEAIIEPIANLNFNK
ncbi:MAG: hypothetical protein K6D91_10000 [Prevotella sp.]|nr:hypothetical protein [Prevotella sp.]